MFKNVGLITKHSGGSLEIINNFDRSLWSFKQKQGSQSKYAPSSLYMAMSLAIFTKAAGCGKKKRIEITQIGAILLLAIH